MTLVPNIWISVTLRGTIGDKNASYSLYYGVDADDSAAIVDAETAIEIQTAMMSMIVNGTAGGLNDEGLMGAMPAQWKYNSLHSYFKWSLTHDAVVAEVPIGLTGTRTIGANDLLGFGVTANFYAPTNKLKQRGAMLSFSGGFEADVSQGQWLSNEGGFILRLSSWLDDMHPLVPLEITGQQTYITPCVVPRIKYVNPDTGKNAYRLPLLLGDVVTPVETTGWLRPVQQSQLKRRRGRIRP